MNKGTLYLIEYDNYIEETNLLYQRTHSGKIRKLFQKYCLQELTTLEGRITAVKQIFNYGYNVPVYINRDLLFIKVHGQQTMWINICTIQQLLKTPKGTDLIFQGDVVLHLDANYRSMVNAYKKAQAILAYKNDFIYE
ncbi:MAG: hypothetical protein GX661_01350 [Acholeplasmataceae bacterium]|nr:hypothetical protein [Acholeplasmataceae bacterium]